MMIFKTTMMMMIGLEHRSVNSGSGETRHEGILHFWRKIFQHHCVRWRRWWRWWWWQWRWRCQQRCAQCWWIEYLFMPLFILYNIGWHNMVAGIKLVFGHHWCWSSLDWSWSSLVLVITGVGHHWCWSSVEEVGRQSGERARSTGLDNSWGRSSLECAPSIHPNTKAWINLLRDSLNIFWYFSAHIKSFELKVQGAPHLWCEKTQKMAYYNSGVKLARLLLAFFCMFWLINAELYEAWTKCVNSVLSFS